MIKNEINCLKLLTSAKQFFRFYRGKVLIFYNKSNAYSLKIRISAKKKVCIETKKYKILGINAIPPSHNKKYRALFCSWFLLKLVWTARGDIRYSFLLYILSNVYSLFQELRICVSGIGKEKICEGNRVNFCVTNRMSQRWGRFSCPRFCG